MCDIKIRTFFLSTYNGLYRIFIVSVARLQFPVSFSDSLSKSDREHRRIAQRRCHYLQRMTAKGPFRKHRIGSHLSLYSVSYMQGSLSSKLEFTAEEKCV